MTFSISDRFSVHKNALTLLQRKLQLFLGVISGLWRAEAAYLAPSMKGSVTADTTIINGSR